MVLIRQMFVLISFFFGATAMAYDPIKCLAVFGEEKINRYENCREDAKNGVLNAFPDSEESKNFDKAVRATCDCLKKKLVQLGKVTLMRDKTSRTYTKYLKAESGCQQAVVYGIGLAEWEADWHRNGGTNEIAMECTEAAEKAFGGK